MFETIQRVAPWQHSRLDRPDHTKDGPGLLQDSLFPYLFGQASQGYPRFSGPPLTVELERKGFTADERACHAVFHRVVLRIMFLVRVQLSSTSSRGCGFVDKPRTALRRAGFRCGQTCGFLSRLVHIIHKPGRFDTSPTGNPQVIKSLSTGSARRVLAPGPSAGISQGQVISFNRAMMVRMAPARASSSSMSARIFEQAWRTVV